MLLRNREHRGFRCLLPYPTLPYSIASLWRSKIIWDYHLRSTLRILSSSRLKIRSLAISMIFDDRSTTMAEWPVLWCKSFAEYLNYCYHSHFWYLLYISSWHVLLWIHWNLNAFLFSDCQIVMVRASCGQKSRQAKRKGLVKTKTNSKNVWLTNWSHNTYCSTVW